MTTNVTPRVTTARRLWRLMAAGAAVWCAAVPLVAQSSDTLSIQQRIVIATRIYTAAQASFAQWEGVPGLDLDREYAAYVAALSRSADRRAFDLASMAFVATLANGHTWFGDWWLRRRDGQALGFYAHPIAGKWTITESATPGLDVGDVIERIDSTSMGDLYAANRRFLFGSDERWRERTLFEHPYVFPRHFAVHLASGRVVEVTRTTPFVFHGDDWVADSVRVQDGILLIRIPSFSKPAFEDSALAALRANPGARAVVLDLRGNHGGSVPTRLVRAFMDRPYRNWIESTPSSVGLFRTWGVIGPHAQMEWPSEPLTPAKPLYAGPLYILVDGGCYSACEDAVMPFLDTHRATVVGEPTAGSSSQTNVIDLGDGMAVGISVVRFRFPDGRPFEGVGLAPDVVVPTRSEDLHARVDPVYAAVVRMVNAHQ